MDADTLDALDNFINDASDQAAAWYSIVKREPVVLPSTQIAVQGAQASQVAAQPSIGVVSTPLGTSIDISTLVLLVGAVIVGFFVFRG